MLIGKHVDKFEADTAKGIRTLPVILGEERSLFLTQELMVSFFVLVLSVWCSSGTLGVWTLLVFGACRAWSGRCSRSTTGSRARVGAAGNYPIWPLWGPSSSRAAPESSSWPAC